MRLGFKGQECVKDMAGQGMEQSVSDPRCLDFSLSWKVLRQIVRNGLLGDEVLLWLALGPQPFPSLPSDS